MPLPYSSMTFRIDIEDGELPMYAYEGDPESTKTLGTLAQCSFLKQAQKLELNLYG